ncbi:fungal-specific transcription factor domain-containing protein [Aspergillus pseudodeflectus]|uniref:Fungal-specific transcription factor domain-containing protein n=1 Tax=Aspergillus pseudodeflectus TaxID=176178 RepID=A0ABR4KMK7_9EURO
MFKSLLQNYFRVMHVRDPILHDPSIWLAFTNFEAHMQAFPSASNSAADLRSDEQISTGILFLCMASVGHKSAPEMTYPNPHTTRCCLYKVAIHVLQPLLHLTSKVATTLQPLLGLTLLVLYYSRLGLYTQSERLLTHTISRAQSIGLHREQTYTDMPVYENQMYRRVWWALYSLDRRISLEAEQPGMMSDGDITTEPPLNVSNEWLQKYVVSSATISQLKVEVDLEVSNTEGTMFQVLSATATYSRVIEAFQKTLLAAQSRGKGHGHIDMSIAYLDALMDDAQSRLPERLKCVDVSMLSEEQPEGVYWCSNNHAILIHVRYLVLKLRIRLAAAATVSASEGYDFLTRQAECLEYASRIVQYLTRLAMVYGVHYSQYVASCTTLMLRVVHSLPVFRRCHCDTIIKGVTILRDCTQNNAVAARLSTLELWLDDALSTTEKRPDNPLHPSPGSLGRSFLGAPHLNRRTQRAETVSGGYQVEHLVLDPGGAQGLGTPTSSSNETYLDSVFDMEMVLGDEGSILTSDIQRSFSDSGLFFSSSDHDIN